MKEKDPMEEIAKSLLAQFTQEEIDDMKRKYEEMVEEQTKIQLQKMKSSVKSIEESE